MQIDWFTLGAQAFNFVLLAILLWFVLYRPVRDAVDKREKEIESRVESARQEKEKAKSLMEEHRRKEAELEERRDSLIREAEEEAEEHRKELRQEIREEMEEAREDWKESLRKDREAFLMELSERVREEVFQVMKQGLTDLVEGEAAEAVVSTFLRRTREAPEKEKEALARAIVETDGRCTVRSAMEIPEEERQKIQEVLEDWVREIKEDGSGTVELEMEVEDEAPWGIEVWAGARKLGWTVEGYVEGLREKVAGILDSEAKEKGSRKDDEKAEDKASREDEEREAEEGEE